ncbi:small conductance mechanosensitive channel MscS [Caenibius tardaugens NBRC 16725]|uniref:Small conductance mechanosensitive channel MscS n=1 Tax=Caenibius tardaugens NBRC 16725 TaxID=1219035 RepID=U2YM32_9SPHN|nr:mechanosensitive ion channel domain-containing protein [Caenibius tardaugens]AZI36822.1 mechanosensitive ion channel protein [Caenibius tardaugens NBRC 16725]GAD49502.1 small conductance mechanosensitive channel MscS [Caenibius tardaugens NBRC 16725]
MGTVAGAEGIKQAVSSENMPLARFVETLDSYAIDVGKAHISAWDALVVIFVIISVVIFAKLISKLSHFVLTRITRLDPTQKLLADKLASIAVWAIAVLIGIDFLGIDLTALAVFSGAFGLAIGFGLQKTFGNLIAGIILLMDRSIKPGDVIAVSDMSGRESFGQIRKIGIRAISVTTRDMKEYLIPNENLMVNQVENWSYSTRNVRVKVPVPVAFGTDIELAERLMMQATVAAPRVLENPDPKVLLVALGENAINFEIRFWIMDPEEGIGGVRSDVLKNVWRLFQEHDIRIPYPQRDVHLTLREQARDSGFLADIADPDRTGR